MQLGNPEAIHPDSGSTRACRECAASRVRCLRGNPCRRCSLKNLVCDYPSDQNTKKLPRKPQAADTVGTALESSAAESCHGEGNSHVTGDSIPPNLERGQGVYNGFQSVCDMPVDQQVPRYALGYGPNPTSSPNLDPQALGQLNWLSPPAQDHFDWDFLDQLPISFPDLLPAPGGLPGMAEVDPPDESMTLASQLAGPSIQPHVQMSPASAGTTSSSHGMSPTQSPATCGVPQCGSQALSPGSSAGTYYVDGNGARAPFRGHQVLRRGSRITFISPADDRAQIDILHQDDHAPSTALSSDCLGIYHSLIDGLASHGLNGDTRPSPAYIDTCIRLYFERFHPVFPFIRRAEIGNGRQPWPLLLAVTATGARYTEGPALVPFRDALLDSLHRALDNEFYHSLLGLSEGAWTCSSRPTRSKLEQLPYLQAGLLHVLIMLHSGNSALMKRAISARYYVVEACGVLQLLSSPEARSKPGGSEPPDLQSWITQQSKLRVGFMIFVSYGRCYTSRPWPANLVQIMDYMLAYELNLKCLMQVSDAQGLLPCHDEVWETPSTGNVSAACPTLGTCSLSACGPRKATCSRLGVNAITRSVTLQEALEMLYMEKRMPPRPAEFATTVLIQAIVRHAREAANLSPLWSWTPSSAVQTRPQADQAQSTLRSKWRDCACDCLDTVHWRANSKAAGLAGWEHPTILQLHLSRFILLTPVAHIQTLAAMSASSEVSRSETGNTLAVAQTQVLQWAVHDQYKARLCLIHAGSVFWHVRHYSVDSIVEPFAIYIAVLVVWAYAVSMKFLNTHGLPRARERLGDQTRTEAPGSAAHVLDAADAAPERGVPDPPFIHLDRPLDDELVQTWVRLGDKMAGYMLHVGNISDEGAPKRILKEGVRLLLGASEGARSTGDSAGFAENKDTQYIWGVEGEYVELLSKLVKVSV